MSVLSKAVLSTLAEFVVKQVREHSIEYLIGLESKGALLLDRVLGILEGGEFKPVVLYLQGTDYLPAETRRSAKFGLVDDVAFSGRTTARARDYLLEQGVLPSNIHLMAFFRFLRECDRDTVDDVLSEISLPTDGDLLRLPEREVLDSIQSLTLDQKIPASYDNLAWDAHVPQAAYRHLMRELAKSDWFVYYGERGHFDASVLLVESGQTAQYSVPPKLRLWYDKERETLRITPIAFPESVPEKSSPGFSRLLKILTPEGVSAKRREFASQLAAAIQEEIALLGYIKPFFRRLGIHPLLRQQHIVRCFGPRASQVISYIEDTYSGIPDLPIPVDKLGLPQRIDYFWVAIRILRILGAAFWEQEPPRRLPQGHTVSELIRLFSGEASAVAVHAAVDYCADMNLIAAFFDWSRAFPARALRLTENGEAEVGFAHGPEERRLSFLERLGALILAKCPDDRASWWVLEKTPAILKLRFGCKIPQVEVCKHYYGDMSKLHVREDSESFLTWPHLHSQAWDLNDVPDRHTGKMSKAFVLRTGEFERFRHSILNDSQLIGLLAPLETTLELITSSSTMGHHVAIMLDILSDRAGGATYLANSLERALELVERRAFETEETERRELTKQIGQWLEGFDEKCKILVNKRDKLLKHVATTTRKLVSQRRGELAETLMEIRPLPVECRIIPALYELSRVVRQLSDATNRKAYSEVVEIAQQIRVPWTREGDTDPVDDPFGFAADSVIDWTRALSAWQGETEDYNKARLEVPAGKSGKVVIVAYDLIGSSKGKYTSWMAADRDKRIQSIITNWFIAFGGYAQRAELAGGDLGFGFFRSEAVAVQAALWATHHLEFLKVADPTLRQKDLHAGFGIVEDSYHSGFMDQVRSDALSRFAKAWKREAERIADNAGRLDRPPVAIHRDLASPLSGIPNAWIGDAGTLDGIQVMFIRSSARLDFPWE